MAISDILIASWYGKHKPLWCLYPFTKMYEWVVTRRRQSYLKFEKDVYRAPVPVIVVGNITVGGTGKTPMILWLIEHCQSLGLKVGVVSRGYGAKPTHFPWMVKADQASHLAGDEPLLIVQRTQVPLAIDPKRSQAVQYLLTHFAIDIILADDGLQHYALGRDLELVMVDMDRQFGNGYCMPMGPLREPVSRLNTVDAVIYNGASTDPEGAFSLCLKPECWVNVHTKQELPLSSFSHKKVHAVAGIGNPERFFNSLAVLGLDVITHPFDDHAVFTGDLLDFKDDLPVIMTEKDAVKCASFAKAHWWYLKVNSQPSIAFIDWFNIKISELMQK